MPHVALAADATYLPWCATAMRSCLDHCAPGLTLHLLHDGQLDDNPGVELVAAMVREAEGELVVHSVDPDEVDSFPLNDYFGQAVWLRLLLPQVLGDVDRVLYIDADTLVMEPLQPLLEIDLNGAPLAAVANVYSPADRDRVHALGVADHRRYLNSGVLLLDLDRLRNERAVEELKRVVTERADELRMPDQDALNLLFTERWHSLHPRWNAQNKLWEDRQSAREYFGDAAAEARRSPAIVHFEGPGPCKPWHALNVHPWRKAWWETMRRTPFPATRAVDEGRATRVLRHMPRPIRFRAYPRVVRWRARRAAGARRDG